MLEEVWIAKFEELYFKGWFYWAERLLIKREFLESELTIEQVFKQAVEAHRAGKIQDAGRLYVSILKLDPKHADANHNMGILAFGLGKGALALPLFKTAVEVKPGVGLFWLSYIDVLIKLDKLSEARVVFDQARTKGLKGEGFDKLAKQLPGSVNKLGEIQDPPVDQLQPLIDFYNKGQLQQALSCASLLLHTFANSATVYSICGAVYAGLKQYDDAINSYQKAITIKPDYAEAYYNMGVALMEKGDLDTAIDSYKKALTIKPDYIDAYMNIASTLKNKGELGAAIKNYKMALKVQPNNADIFYNMGNAQKQMQDLDAAIDSYKKVIKFKPGSVDAYYNMGVVLVEKGNFDAGIDCYKQALKIKPDYAEAHNNIGNVLKETGNLDAAADSYKQALKINPDYADASYNIGLEFLRDQNFVEGFQLMELRWKTKQDIGVPLASSKPLWNGEKNQTVFVWSEQGVGDVVMFASLIPELHSVSSQLIVQCDKRLIPLFQRSFPKDIIYHSDRTFIGEDKYDFHTPIGSIARIFRTSLESFQTTSNGYLRCDEARAHQLRKKLLTGDAKTLVGISWKTSSPLQNSNKRNIKLSDLAQALDSPDTQLVCLQYGDVSGEIARLKKEFGINVAQVSEIDNRNDIDDLSSLITACDGVVSTTNATVHLAGALGVAVKVLLPFSSRWMWGRSASHNPWYGSVTSYRQQVSDDWSTVLKSL